jgi:hypothetical protein
MRRFEHTTILIALMGSALGLAESERLPALWHRFRAGECDRRELQRRLIPLQDRLGRRSRVYRMRQRSPRPQGRVAKLSIKGESDVRPDPVSASRGL